MIDNSPRVSRIVPPLSDASKSIVSPGAAAAMASRSEMSPSSMLPSALVHERIDSQPQHRAAHRPAGAVSGIQGVAGSIDDS